MSEIRFIIVFLENFVSSSLMWIRYSILWFIVDKESLHSFAYYSAVGLFKFNRYFNYRNR